MIKRYLCLFLIICTALSSTVFAASFSDLPADTTYRDAILSLAEEGIINGYSDGTFRPSGHITRAESAAIIVRAAELSESADNSIYSDVPENHWACSYIMAATKADILNGFGNGIFSPSGKVTYNQILKMIVCMLGRGDKALSNGGWPKGYIKEAHDSGIIDNSKYNSIMYGKDGDLPATRGDVALFIHNALTFIENNTLRIGEKELTLGMSSDALDSPDEILSSTANFNWYVYGSDTYKLFYAVGVDKNKVVAIASTGLGFNYKSYECGSIKADNEKSDFIYTDKNDGDIIHSVLILDDNYDIGFSSAEISKDKLSDEAKMNFHFTNAFRVYHGLNALKWSDNAATSARLHSEDMATNDYFAHEGLNGSNCGSRMDAQGINWSFCGENIAGGTIRYLGFHAFDGWVNSEGHRNNMLKPAFTYLGVGIAYDRSAKYTYYHTQNFFS